MNQADRQNKINLAAAYRILALRKMDDLTYTHLSIRSSKKNTFFIYPFGLQFNEVTASSLLEVDFDGTILSGKEKQYNQTGYVIHGNIYKAREDINAIFHLHTHAGIAVSADKRGLMPLSQFALHLYGKISFHKYNSLELDFSHNSLAADLGDKNFCMMLENHGTITCGRTIQEAMFYTHHLEQACKVQTLLNAVDEKNLIIPSHEICLKSNRTLLGFEKDLGGRDWVALIRELDNISPDYKT